MMEFLPYALGVAAALVLITLFLGSRYLLETRRRTLAERLQEPDEEGDLDLLSELGKNKNQTNSSLVENTGLDLTGNQATGWILLSAMILGAGMFLVRGEWWMGLIGLGLGGLGTFVSFYFFKARYRNQIQNQLPDTFYLLARSLRAGLSLEQAILMLGNQGLEPLASEFKRCSSQVRLGLSIPTALSNMAQRLELVDFNAFVSAIGLFQNTGGNLPLILDRLASSTRDFVQFRNHFRSATALARISSYAIAAAPPLIFLLYSFIDPEYIQDFFTTRLGLLLLGSAIALEIIGILWLRYLLKSEI